MNDVIEKIKTRHAWSPGDIGATEDGRWFIVHALLEIPNGSSKLNVLQGKPLGQEKPSGTYLLAKDDKELAKLRPVNKAAVHKIFEQAFTALTQKREVATSLSGRSLHAFVQTLEFNYVQPINVLTLAEKINILATYTRSVKETEKAAANYIELFNRMTFAFAHFYQAAYGEPASDVRRRIKDALWPGGSGTPLQLPGKARITRSGTANKKQGGIEQDANAAFLEEMAVLAVSQEKLDVARDILSGKTLLAYVFSLVPLRKQPSRSSLADRLEINTEDIAALVAGAEKEVERELERRKIKAAGPEKYIAGVTAQAEESLDSAALADAKLIFHQFGTLHYAVHLLSTALEEKLLDAEIAHNVNQTEDKIAAIRKEIADYFEQRARDASEAFDVERGIEEINFSIDTDDSEFEIAQNILDRLSCFLYLAFYYMRNTTSALATQTGLPLEKIQTLLAEADKMVNAFIAKDEAKRLAAERLAAEKAKEANKPRFIKDVGWFEVALNPLKQAKVNTHLIIKEGSTHIQYLTTDMYRVLEYAYEHPGYNRVDKIAQEVFENDYKKALDTVKAVTRSLAFFAKSHGLDQDKIFSLDLFRRGLRFHKPTNILDHLVKDGPENAISKVWQQLKEGEHFYQLGNVILRIHKEADPFPGTILGSKAHVGLNKEECLVLLFIAQPENINRIIELPVISEFMHPDNWRAGNSTAKRCMRRVTNALYKAYGTDVLEVAQAEKNETICLFKKTQPSNSQPHISNDNLTDIKDFGWLMIGRNTKATRTTNAYRVVGTNIFISQKRYELFTYLYESSGLVPRSVISQNLKISDSELSAVFVDLKNDIRRAFKVLGKLPTVIIGNKRKHGIFFVKHDPLGIVEITRKDTANNNSNTQNDACSTDLEAMEAFALASHPHLAEANDSEENEFVLKNEIKQILSKINDGGNAELKKACALLKPLPLFVYLSYNYVRGTTDKSLSEALQLPIVRINEILAEAEAIIQKKTKKLPTEASCSTVHDFETFKLGMLGNKNLPGCIIGPHAVAPISAKNCEILHFLFALDRRGKWISKEDILNEVYNGAPSKRKALARKIGHLAAAFATAFGDQVNEVFQNITSGPVCLAKKDQAIEPYQRPSKKRINLDASKRFVVSETFDFGKFQIEQFKYPTLNNRSWGRMIGPKGSASIAKKQYEILSFLIAPERRGKWIIKRDVCDHVYRDDRNAMARLSNDVRDVALAFEKAFGDEASKIYQNILHGPVCLAGKDEVIQPYVAPPKTPEIQEPKIPTAILHNYDLGSLRIDILDKSNAPIRMTGPEGAVDISEKSYEILAHLLVANQKGESVTKQEMIEKFWPKNLFQNGRKLFEKKFRDLWKALSEIYATDDVLYTEGDALILNTKNLGITAFLPRQFDDKIIETIPFENFTIDIVNSIKPYRLAGSEAAVTISARAYELLKFLFIPERRGQWVRHSDVINDVYGDSPAPRSELRNTILEIKEALLRACEVPFETFFQSRDKSLCLAAMNQKIPRLCPKPAGRGEAVRPFGQASDATKIKDFGWFKIAFDANATEPDRKFYYTETNVYLHENDYKLINLLFEQSDPLPENAILTSLGWTNAQFATHLRRAKTSIRYKLKEFDQKSIVVIEKTNDGYRFNKKPLATSDITQKLEAESVPSFVTFRLKLKEGVHLSSLPSLKLLFDSAAQTPDEVGSQSHPKNVALTKDEFKIFCRLHLAKHRAKNAFEITRQDDMRHLSETDVCKLAASAKAKLLRKHPDSTLLQSWDLPTMTA